MLCVRMYAVCRSHLCIVNVREYEVQDTFPLQYVPTEHKLQVLVSSLRERTEGDATQATQNAVEIQISLEVYRQHIDADSQCAGAAHAIVAQCEERVEQRD